MPEADWWSSESGRSLVREVVATVVRQYRIDPERAATLVHQAFTANPELQRAVGAGGPPERLARTRVFKDAVVSAKRQIYHELRRYSSEAEAQSALIARLAELAGHGTEEVGRVAVEIARTHASTRERLPDREAFYRELLPRLGDPASILDVGCGMQPLLFPFAATGRALQRYVAAEKDPACVAAVEAFARAWPEPRLRARRWDIRQGWPVLAASAEMERYDVAFLLKLVPVVERQAPELLEVLGRTPARLWVVSGSRVALAKRQDIERRERLSLRRFAELSGREVVGEFSIAEELVCVLGRKGDGPLQGLGGSGAVER